MTNINKEYQAFRNPEVIVTTYSDKRVAAIRTDSCWLEQECDGPTYVVIRPSATDEQLNLISSRLQIPNLDLKHFRDTEAI